MFFVYKIKKPLHISTICRDERLNFPRCHPTSHKDKSNYFLDPSVLLKFFRYFLITLYDISSMIKNILSSDNGGNRTAILSLRPLCIYSRIWGSHLPGPFSTSVAAAFSAPAALCMLHQYLLVLFTGFI